MKIYIIIEDHNEQNGFEVSIDSDYPKVTRKEHQTKQSRKRHMQPSVYQMSLWDLDKERL